MNLKNAVKVFPSVLFSFSNILNLGITILISIIISFFKNDEIDFGKAIFALTLINVITYLNEYGFSETVQVFAVEKKYQKIFTHILKNQFVLNLFWGILMFGVAVLSGFTYIESFLLLPCIFYSQLNILIAGFVGLNQKIRASAYQIATVLLSLASILILSFLGNNNFVSAVVGLGIGVCTCFVAIVIDYKIQGLLNEGQKLDNKLSLFAKNTFWYYVWFLLLSQSDIFFLNYFLGIESVGIYKTIFQIASLFKIPAVLISAPMLSLLSQRLKSTEIKKDINKIKIIVKQILLGFTMFSAALLGLTYFFGDIFLNLVYGFKELNYLLLVLAFAAVVEGLNFLIITYFQASEKSSIVWKITFFQLFIYLILMFIGARNLSSTAFIMLFIQFVGLACHLFFFLKYIESDYSGKHIASQPKIKLSRK